jgi:hypothetical protein
VDALLQLPDADSGYLQCSWNLPIHVYAIHEFSWIGSNPRIFKDTYLNRDAEANEREGGREKGWKEVRKRERERERERSSQTERQIEREAGSPPTFLNSPHTHTHTHTHKRNRDRGRETERRENEKEK